MILEVQARHKSFGFGGLEGKAYTLWIRRARRQGEHRVVSEARRQGIHPVVSEGAKARHTSFGFGGLEGKANIVLFRRARRQGILPVVSEGSKARHKSSDFGGFTTHANSFKRLALMRSPRTHSRLTSYTPRTRAHFTPQHWLICHLGLY